MNIAVVIFWSAFALVAYTFVGYPLWLALRSRWPRPVRREPNAFSVSVILAVRNEERNIGRRLTELIAHLEGNVRPWEILVASDGSTDATAAIARDFAPRGVRLVELPENRGKAAALTQACHSARNEVLVFADARQTWAPDAIDKLLENFADPNVGAVSGDLVLEASPGVMAGVGVYWKFEKWLRRQESKIHSQVGVTGAISAVRRELFPGIPDGTLLDDVYWPLCVAMAGPRVIHEERAKAFDRLPERPRDEFRRKVRTLAGNFQLVMLLPGSLLPWRNPVWFAWISHKLCRLAAPWALLTMLTANLFLDGWFFRSVLWLQLAGYAVAIAGMWEGFGRHIKFAGAGASFLVLNAAAWLGFWVWITGRAGRSWHKIAYDDRRLRLSVPDELSTNATHTANAKPQAAYPANVFANPSANEIAGR